MARALKKRCPDCGGDLGAIRLVDRGDHEKHSDFSYAAADAKRSFWLGRYPIQGVVRGYLCAGCGRVLLYGEADTKKK